MILNTKDNLSNLLFMTLLFSLNSHTRKTCTAISSLHPGWRPMHFDNHFLMNWRKFIYFLVAAHRLGDAYQISPILSGKALQKLIYKSVCYLLGRKLLEGNQIIHYLETHRKAWCNAQSPSSFEMLPDELNDDNIFLMELKSTFNIWNFDISNSAKLYSSIWIKNTFWLLSQTIIRHWILFTSPDYPKCKLICTWGNLNL